jgi:hypothetical protein
VHVILNTVKVTLMVAVANLYLSCFSPFLFKFRQLSGVGSAIRILKPSTFFKNVLLSSFDVRFGSLQVFSYGALLGLD